MFTVIAYFIKKIIFFKSKNLEEWYYFSSLQTSVISGLREDPTGFSYLLLLNLLQYIVFIEIYEENPASHKYVVRKGKYILIVFRIIVTVLESYIKTH